jgi:hypothetical protein
LSFPRFNKTQPHITKTFKSSYKILVSINTITSVLIATKSLYDNSYITLETSKYTYVQTYWFRLCELVAVNEFDRFWFSCMNFNCIFVRIWENNCRMNSFPILTVCYCITSFTSQWKPRILKNKLPMTPMQKTIC